MKRRAAPVRGLLSAAMAAALLPTAAALFGKEYWLFELATHFRPQLAIGAACLMALAAAARRPVLALIALLVAAVNAVPWMSYPARDASGVRAGPVTLRIMFANVNWGNSDYDAALAAIEAEDPDVIGLAEVDHRWIEGLSELREEYSYSVERPQDGAYGLALFSRVPIRELGTSPYVQERVQTAIGVEVELLGHPLTLTLAHLMAPMSRAKANLRNVQIEAIASMVKQSPQPQVVFGDLNITPWSPEYSPLEEAGLVNAARGLVYSPTWPASLRFLGIPIDHVLLSDEFEVQRVHTGKAFGSDHLPVVADIAFDENERDPAK